jgi:hypothetical protein
MFNFLFSSSRIKKSKTNRMERILEQCFALPELDSAMRENTKKRIINRIQAEQEEKDLAQVLDTHIHESEQKNSSSVIDTLASIAEALIDLPKTLPRLAWREKTRENFETEDMEFAFFAFLKRATAFAVLIIIIASIGITTLVSQTQTAVAQLSVNSGIVKLREAKSPFFEEVSGIITIRLGDTIRVEKNSTAELSFYDASKMSLTESTEVAITEFAPNFISREDSAVKVALLSGAINAEVAKEKSSFSVETTNGSVEAQNAKFSVSIDSTGKTKIKTSEDSVAVKSIQSSESVALIEGEAIVFADANSEVLISKNLDKNEEIKQEDIQFPNIEKIAQDIDFIKIRSFDALIDAQKDKITVARKIHKITKEKLSMLLSSVGIEEIDSGGLDAMKIFISKNYPVSDQREIILQNLTQIGQLRQILNYYFVAPQFLRGAPEFQILAKSNYQPYGKLRNIFTVLRAKKLAHVEIHPMVDDLANQLTIELVDDLREYGFGSRLENVLDHMDDQPIFLPVLRQMRILLPEGIVESVDQRIGVMEGRVAEYMGKS